MKNYFGEILEQIFTDIAKLYKNYFLHWTLTRFLVVLYVFVIALVFIIIPGCIFLFQHLGSEKILEYINFFKNHAEDFENGVKIAKEAYPIFPAFSDGTILSGIVLGFVALVLTFFGASYANDILLTKSYLGYIQDTPVDQKDNLYFSWTFFSKFFGVRLYQIAIQLGLLLVAAILIGIITISVGGLGHIIAGSFSNLPSIFYISSIIILIAYLFSSVYFSLRFYFTSQLLVTTDNTDLPPIEYIKQSWNMTKDKAGWIFLIGLIAGLAVGIATAMIGGILELIPYAGFFLSYLVTGYVIQIIPTSIFVSMKKYGEAE